MLAIVSSPLPCSPAGLFADISFYLEVSRLNRASITKAITQKLFPVDNLMSICFYFTQTDHLTSYLIPEPVQLLQPRLNLY